MTTGTIHDSRNKRIMELGMRYWQKMQGRTPGLFDRKYWQGQFVDWIMKDEAFKIDAFRFIDVLPSLNSTSAVGSHVRDYFLKEGRDLPGPVRTALKMTTGTVTAPLAVRMVRANVAGMGRRFICENESNKTLKLLRGLAREKLAFSVDILGEATTSEFEAQQYLQKYVDLIALLSEAAEKWPAVPQLHASPQGPIPKVNVSLKISALDPYLDASDHRGSVSRLKERLLPLLRMARQKNVFINFDLEQWAVHNITCDLFSEVVLHQDLIDWPHIGIVLQAYLKESGQDCDRFLALSKQRGTPFTVRLVKGAYWDYEVVHARQNGFTCPVYTKKGLTDANYENLSIQLIDNHELVSPAFAGHNMRSLVHAIVVAEEKGLDKTAIELQMLYGMAEPERRVFADDGYRVRIYCPIGELLPGMAYLVRRLLENTSSSSFLRQSFHERVSIDSMLEPPVLEQEIDKGVTVVSGDIDSPFANQGLLDFCEKDVRDGFDSALAKIRQQLPFQIPLSVGGKEIMTQDVLDRESPNDPALLVARVSRADVARMDEALQVAAKAFPVWREVPLRRRAELLEKTAELLEQDRLGLAALQAFEVGKPRIEADADVAEAIDFCRYYARRAPMELGPAKQGDIAGEDNILCYEGRGPAVIIAPWNFPLAILCGMTTAALVTGNTVLIKPASNSSAVAYRFYRHLLAAGFSPETAQFLPGSGEETGNYLAAHSAVAQIAFTGSKEVGLDIIRQAANTRAGQAEVKRVVCEMGGKNAIIVDDDADPDAALKGVIQSAFGYAGQKCSACSRLILVGTVYDLFVERLIEACRSLPLAPATEASCRMGPVIDQRARDRLMGLIEGPPAGAELIFKGEIPATGYFVPPAIFKVTDPENPMMQQELFGPLLTVIKVDNFTTAIDIANSTEFALTGGVYSRSPSNLALARSRFKVGNLYINRACTGAIVGRQPFGGYGMSGIGTKAGGPGYLRNFANPRCISENTMRSGFTPELQL
ncbi:MAG: proline dehydrogenase family protein [Desulfobulbaceae bacterium]|nr:proline dehydrogenase family protein [Desulfobulbaceae bacterium]